MSKTKRPITGKLCYVVRRRAFYDAANQVEGEVIALLQLMELMFEPGFLDVSDMRWRTPDKDNPQVKVA